MNSNDKKISFGFSKLVKKPAVILNKPPEQKKLELIDCLEGQSIKVKDAVEVIVEPLVIPIKDSQKNLLDRVKEAKEKQKKALEKSQNAVEDDRPDSELTIEELAARELIREAKSKLERPTTSSKIHTLPLQDIISLDGEKEPTLEDYENVPINDFGMAMLRGMGWKEGQGLGKNPSKTAVTNAPELRPKGLGLGANKMIKNSTKPVDKDGKELILIKGAYAKIIAGNHKGSYCQVQGLDDEASRIIVKTSLKGEILTLNEFLLLPVTKEEYEKSSKVLNNAKYEEYIEKQKQAKGSKDEESISVEEEYQKPIKKEKDYKEEKKDKNYENHRRSRSRSKERNRRRERSRSKSKKSKHRDTSSSEESYYSKTKKNKKHKSKKSKSHRNRSTERDYRKSDRR